MKDLIVRLLSAASFIYISCLGVFPVFAESDEVLQHEFSWKAPLARQSLLLSISGANQDIWLAGARGHILKNGSKAEWLQTDVPVSVLLTAIHMQSPEHGWAVGHDAVILGSTDGGLSWSLLYSDPEQQRPLLDVFFFNEQRGIAIGAYGYFLTTHDGGNTWQESLVNEEHDFHLNAIDSNAAGNIYIAGEAGNVYRSENQGETWKTLDSPYHGSFFDVLAWGESNVVIGGLRGYMFLSRDRGESWEKLPLSISTSINTIIRLHNGQLLAAGHAGNIVLLNDDFTDSYVYRMEDRKAISDIYEVDNNQVVIVGESGVNRLSLCQLFTAEQLFGCENK